MQWFSIGMLKDAELANLLGPDPLILVKFVVSDQFNVVPLNLIEDIYWNCHANEVFENNNANCSHFNSTGKQILYPLKQFSLDHLKKVNSKMSASVQESLIKAAAIGENEVSFLRQIFYANSFPSRFMNCEMFCTKFCEPVLGETNQDVQQDYFR